jgi:hypothetical protein
MNGGYGRTKSMRKEHSKIWTPIEVQTRKLYDALIEENPDEPIDYREFQKLGKMIRNAVPARPERGERPRT